MIILLEDKDTIVCVPPATLDKAATIQTLADPSEVDSEVRARRGPGTGRRRGRNLDRGQELDRRVASIVGLHL
jgi:hypothetical protein